MICRLLCSLSRTRWSGQTLLSPRRALFEFRRLFGAIAKCLLETLQSAY